MRNDMTPLLRATVGFDRMMNLLDASTRIDEGTLAYPPYNIEKLGEDDYRITMAVAGFAEDELDVTVKENSVIISGRRASQDEKNQASYLHRGIATRAFERRFDLAEHIKVTGAKLENGLLHVLLVREVPETAKPRSVKIENGSVSKAKVIENRAA